MKNIDFFSEEIETKSFIPCNQSWSRAFRNVVDFVLLALAFATDESRKDVFSCLVLGVCVHTVRKLKFAYVS